MLNPTGPGLRRVKKFPSSSVLESEYHNSAPSPVVLSTTQSASQSLANITNHPLAPKRPRSQSQSQFDSSKYPVNNNQRYARKAASSAQLVPKQKATIESLISRPPANLVEALQDLRYLILTEGIQADNDGNV